jgi:ABC-type antimicrobial peptide transport system permease subunit
MRISHTVLRFKAPHAAFDFGQWCCCEIFMRSNVSATSTGSWIDAIVELDRQVSQSIAEPRFYSTLLLVFAGLALALAAAGICGSLLFTVGQRVREMGVRLALGAARGDVVRMVVAQGLGLVAVGLGLGLAITLAAGRLIESRLFGIGASDPWTLALACAVLAGVGLLACWLPARRAAATDPVTTLRAD